MDDDDTPGTSVVEAQYAFVWISPALGRGGFGSAAPYSDPTNWYYRWHEVDPGVPLVSWGSYGGSDPSVPISDFRSRFTSATVGYFPAPGVRNYDSGTPAGVAAYGDFWSSGRHAAVARYASRSWFNAADFHATDLASRSDCWSVRCVQEDLPIFLLYLPD